MGQDRLDDVRVVGNAQLVGDGQQQRVGLGDSFVLLQLFDKDVRLGGVATAENRPGLFVDEADVVLLVYRKPYPGLLSEESAKLAR